MLNMPITTLLRLVSYLGYNAITKPGFPAYNPNDFQRFYPNPGKIYDEILAKQPVFFSPRLASWIITRYDDVAECLRDPRLDPNFQKWRFAPPSTRKNDWDHLTSGLLFTLDRANHARIRRITTPAFGPRTLATIQAKTQQVVDHCLDQISPGSTINYSEAIAFAIPREVIAALVGVKKEDQLRFEALTRSVIALFDPSIDIDTDYAQQGIDLMKEYIAERKDHPGDDFLSLLLGQSAEGDKISEWEAIALIASLIAAGPDTSSDDLNFAVYNLLLHPQVMDQLLAQPALLENFILEHTRHNHFGYAAPIRFALEDVVISGQRIRRGEMMRLIIPAAMRDPRVFERPDVFDIHRPNLHKVLRYGVGPHYCLGSAVAQTIVTTTLAGLLQRFPRINLLEPPRFEKHLTSRRINRLMVRVASRSMPQAA